MKFAQKYILVKVILLLNYIFKKISISLFKLEYLNYLKLYI